MVKELLLPQRRRETRGPQNSFRGPLLEAADEARQRCRVGSLIAGAKEMQMIRHDHEPANHPALSLGSGFEFGAQDGEGLVVRQQPTPARDTNRQKIDGRFEPNPVEAARMLVASQGTESLEKSIDCMDYTRYRPPCRRGRRPRPPPCSHVDATAGRVRRGQRPRLQGRNLARGRQMSVRRHI
jgi:hypothetical protein